MLVVTVIQLASLEPLDLSCRRNACFLAGVMCAKAGSKALGYYQRLVEAIVPLLKLDLNSTEVKNSAERAKREYADSMMVLGLRDNAVAAAAKMVLFGAKELNLREIVPLMLDGLPLEADIEEAQFVYSSVVKMVNLFPSEHPGLIEPFLSKIASIFEHVLSKQSQRIPAKLRLFLKGTLAQIKTKLDAPRHGQQTILEQKSDPNHTHPG